MRKLIFKVITSSCLLAVILTCVFLGSCSISKSVKSNNDYFVDATKDEILKHKDADVRAILFAVYIEKEICPEWCFLIGNPNEFKKITNQNYEFEKIVRDKKWIPRFLNEYQRAIREGIWQGSFSDARIIFITEKRGYMFRFDCDNEAKVVYNEYLSSKKLWQYMDEIGFIEHEEPSPIPELKKCN